jgi:hypothetical protein
MPVTDLSSAKRRVLAQIGDEPWCRGVGIGLVGPERRKGLIVSLASDVPQAARKKIESLAEGVPVELRVVGDLRKRG